MKDTRTIPYKIYLEESEMPTHYYNVRADMKKKPAPLLNPATLKPMTAEELSHVFCDELVKQELDDETAYFEIPREIREILTRNFTISGWISTGLSGRMRLW